MPKIGKQKGGDDPGTSTALPPGEYGVAWTSFTRRQSKRTGKDYLRVGLSVTDGRHKGSRFFTVFSCDLSKGGTVQKWRLLLDCLYPDDDAVEFEIGDSAEGTADEGDRQIAQFIKGRPFRVKLSRKEVNGYENNEIDRFVFPRMVSPAQREAMDEWRKNWLAKRGDHGAPPEDAPPADDWRGDSPPPDEDPYEDPTRGMGRAPDFGSGELDDDDIPF